MENPTTQKSELKIKPIYMNGALVIIAIQFLLIIFLISPKSKSNVFQSSDNPTPSKATTTIMPSIASAENCQIVSNSTSKLSQFKIEGTKAFFYEKVNGICYATSELENFVLQFNTLVPNEKQRENLTYFSSTDTDHFFLLRSLTNETELNLLQYSSSTKKLTLNSNLGKLVLEAYPAPSLSYANVFDFTPLGYLNIGTSGNDYHTVLIFTTAGRIHGCFGYDTIEPSEAIKEQSACETEEKRFLSMTSKNTGIWMYDTNTKTVSKISSAQVLNLQ